MTTSYTLPPLADDREVRYDKACVCTGASPKLAIPFSHPLVFGIRDTQSVEDLANQLRAGRARRVVVVGNGAIALELVHTVRDRALETLRNAL